QSYGDGPPSMNPDLEAEPSRSGLVEPRQFFDHLDRHAHSVLRTLEASHHSIADGFDDGAGSLPDDLVQDIEMLTNEKVRVHIAHAFIQGSRVLQIGKQIR